MKVFGNSGITSATAQVAPKLFNALNSGLTNFSNFVLFKNPLASAINTTLDIDGSRAAQAAYQNNLALQKQQQEFSAIEAQKSREHAEYLSSTAIQRQVADLKAAGLNPYLAINSGINGASAPSSAVATSSPNSTPMANNKLVVAAGLIATALRMFLTKGK